MTASEPFCFGYLSIAAIVLALDDRCFYFSQTLLEAVTVAITGKYSSLSLKAAPESRIGMVESLHPKKGPLTAAH